MKKFAMYLRVSTQKQGRSGLGLSAQKNMCESFIKEKGGQLLKIFQDVESGTHRQREGLWNAINFCKENSCALVIAKLDRLARDVEFTFRIINTGIEIHFCDMPMVNTMILGVFASVAQYERELNSLRTKQALNVKKSNGVLLGAASENYKLSKDGIIAKKQSGSTKRHRFLTSKDTICLIKILKQVFPLCRDNEESKWLKTYVDTKIESRCRIYELMVDYKDIDPDLFAKWSLKDYDPLTTRWQLKLSSKLNALINSLTGQ